MQICDTCASSLVALRLIKPHVEANGPHGTRYSEGACEICGRLEYVAHNLTAADSHKQEYRNALKEAHDAKVRKLCETEQCVENGK